MLVLVSSIEAPSNALVLVAGLEGVHSLYTQSLILFLLGESLVISYPDLSKMTYRPLRMKIRRSSNVVALEKLINLQ
jgi:hypothetical protein